MDAILCKELDELSAAIDRVLSERDRYKADADRLAEAIRRLDTVNPKMGQRYISTWEIARAALAEHERGEG